MSNDTQLIQNQSSDKNTKKICDLVLSMMNVDNIAQQTRDAIIAMVELTLNSDTYIVLIRQQVMAIISDGTVNQNDLPAILTIVLQSKVFLQSILASGVKIAVNLDMSTLKYIIYAVIHLVMILENANPVVIISLETSFSPLWNLVSINPLELVSSVSIITHKCFPCFYKK